MLNPALPRIVVTWDNVSHSTAIQGHASISVSTCMATKVSDAVGYHKGRHIATEYINDSGAGRHIASERAFLQHGVPKFVMSQVLRPSAQNIQLDTGGGLKGCGTPIGVESNLFGNKGEIYCLKDGQAAMSQGIIVNERNMPHVWQKGSLPWHCTHPEHLRIVCLKKYNTYAERLEDNARIRKPSRLRSVHLHQGQRIVLLFRLQLKDLQPTLPLRFFPMCRLILGLVLTRCNFHPMSFHVQSIAC